MRTPHGESRLNSRNRKGVTMNELEYKNSKIELEESANPKISIDGKPIQVSWDADAREFNAGELPYCSFKSVTELAEAIVEQRLSDA